LIQRHERAISGEEPRLAYNRVAMTSYFQHRSPEELAMASLEWLEEKQLSLESSLRMNSGELLQW